MTASLGRLVRVALAGGAATVADALVLVTLYHGLGFAAGLAAIVGCVAGGAVNFVLHRSCVFQATHAAWWRQAALYATVVVGGGAVVSGAVVAAIHAIGLPLLVAKVGAIGVALVGWTYPMSARVVFAPR